MEFETKSKPKETRPSEEKTLQQKESPVLKPLKNEGEGSKKSLAETVRERVMKNVEARFKERGIDYNPREKVKPSEANKAVEQTAKAIAGSDYEMPRQTPQETRRQVEYNLAMREDWERPDAMLTSGEYKAREETGLKNTPNLNPVFRDVEFLAQNRYMPGGSWYFRGSSTFRGMTDGYGGGNYNYKSPTTAAPGMSPSINYPASGGRQYNTTRPPSPVPSISLPYTSNLPPVTRYKTQPPKPSESTAGSRTGSWLAKTPAEKALEARARANPANGSVLDTKMGDSRWPASAGWKKMEQRDGDIVIHYNYNPRTRQFADPKIQGPSKNGSPKARIK